MADEPNGSGDATIIVVTPGEGATGEAGEGGTVQIVGASAESEAVEIARIEAEARVTVAAIEADTSIEHHELNVAEMEALTTVVENGELAQCRLKIAELEGANAALILELEMARATPLILAPLAEPPPPPPPPPSGAEDGPPASPVAVEPEAAPPPPEAPRPKPKAHRWI